MAICSSNYCAVTKATEIINLGIRKFPVTNSVCISFNFIVFCVTMTICEVVDDTSFTSVQHSDKLEHSGFVCILSSLIALAMTIILYDKQYNYYAKSMPILTLLADMLLLAHMQTTLQQLAS